MAEVIFNAGEHTYRVAGQRLPSVTEILAPLNDLDGVPRHLLEAAAAFGSHVHQACDLWNKGALDESALDPHLVPYLAGWKQYLFDTGNRVIESERIVYHDKHRYCGTFDAVAVGESFRKTCRYLIDIKSGVVPRSVGAQLAAYENAYRDETKGAKLVRRCIQLTGDGNYKVTALDDDAKDWNLFISCLNVFRYLQEK